MSQIKNKDIRRAYDYCIINGTWHSYSCIELMRSYLEAGASNARSVECILTTSRLGEYAFDFAVVVFGVRILSTYVLSVRVLRRACYRSGRPRLKGNAATIELSVISLSRPAFVLLVSVITWK